MDTFNKNSVASFPFLPEDIVRQILHNLPVKSLFRFRCVCKSWLNLPTSDHVFIQSHLQQSVLNSTIRQNNVIMYSTTVGKNSDVSPEDEAKELIERLVNSGDGSNNNLSRPSFLGTNSFLVGSCNGIICVAKCRDGDNCCPAIYLCNPAIRECRSLPPSHFQCRQRSVMSGVLGFFFNSLTGDYNVVKVTYYVSCLNIQIYNLKNDSWNAIKSVSARTFVYGFKIGILHDGSVYWISELMNNREYGLNIFDIKSENFREVLVSDDSFAGEKFFCLWMFKGRLSLIGHSLFQNKADEIRMLDQNGEENSWTKKQYLFSENWRKLSTSYALVMTQHGKLLASRTVNCMVLFDPETDSVEESMKDEVNNWFLADYVESLVSVFPPQYDPKSKLKESIEWKREYERMIL